MSSGSKTKRSLLLVASLLLLSAAPGGFEIVDNIVLTKDYATIVLPPEVVASADVVETCWSGDGKVLLFLRKTYPTDGRGLLRLLQGSEDPVDQPRLQLATYSLAGKQTRSYGEWIAGSTELSSTVPLAGSDTFAVVTDTPKEEGTLHRLVLLSPSRGTLTTLLESSTEIDVSNVSPTIPVGVACFEVEEGISVCRPFGPQGWLGPAWKNDIISPAFTADGRSIIGYSYELRPPAKPKAEFWLIDPITGAQREVAEEPKAWEPPKMDLSIEQETPRSLLLVAEDAPKEAFGKQLLLTADGEHPDAPSNLSAICYRSRSALILRRLVRLPRKGFEKPLVESIRKRDEKAAQQVGLALMMYSNDYDDEWPDANDLVDKVYPYIKDRKSLERFVYTYAGGSMENPEKTQIGYLPALGEGFSSTVTEVDAGSRTLRQKAA